MIVLYSSIQILKCNIPLIFIHQYLKMPLFFLLKTIYFGENCEVGITYTYVLVFTIHMPYIFNTYAFPTERERN